MTSAGLRLGPQMQPVIGMYPSALALVKNGTNSIPPVIEYIQKSGNKEARHVCMEVLRRIEGGVRAARQIEEKLGTAVDGSERGRLEAALQYVKRNHPGPSPEK
ncbi:hypothetical protein ACFLQU_03535 [Verrucomicrobiota bacterium]